METPKGRRVTENLLMCLKTSPGFKQPPQNLNLLLWPDITFFFNYYYSLAVQSLKFRPSDSFYRWAPIITDPKRIFLVLHILNSTFLGYIGNLRVVQPSRLGFGDTRIQDLDCK